MNFLLRFSLFFALTTVFLLGMFAFPSILAAEDLIHMVGKGETVYSISRFYSISADELMRANNLSDPSRLQAGSRLKIPSSAAVSATAVSPGAPQRLNDYRVVRGDTLFSIARTNSISLQTLLEINKFSSNHVIKAGDVIKVPDRGIMNVQPVASNSISTGRVASGVYALRWPVTPKNISYMTGQMGVVVEGEYTESVRSLTQGNVISAGPWRKFGRVVIVETREGYFYMYGGCESLSVNVGDRILPGTEVGRLGINAVSEKPQLFFMVFRSDNPVDPALAPRSAANVKT